MSINFRPVSGNVEFVTSRRGRSVTTDNELNQVVVGVDYVWTEGVDYLPDSSTEDTAPKLSTMRQKLQTIAKKLTQKYGKIISVKVNKGMLAQSDENGEVQRVPGVRYTFVEGFLRKPRKAKTTVESSTSEQESEQESES